MTKLIQFCIAIALELGSCPHVTPETLDWMDALSVHIHSCRNQKFRRPKWPLWPLFLLVLKSKMYWILSASVQNFALSSLKGHQFRMAYNLIISSSSIPRKCHVSNGPKCILQGPFCLQCICHDGDSSGPSHCSKWCLQYGCLGNNWWGAWDFLRRGAVKHPLKEQF